MDSHLSPGMEDSISRMYEAGVRVVAMRGSACPSTMSVDMSEGLLDEAVFSRDLLLRAFPDLAGSGRKRFLMYEEARAAVFAPSLYISDFTTWATAWMRIAPKSS